MPFASEPKEHRIAALTHLATGLAMAAVLCGIVGAATLGTAVRAESSASLRAAAATPLALAVGASAWAYRTRVRIRALREADSRGGPREVSVRPLAEELASERAASRDLLALDRILRAYYRLPAGDGDATVAAGPAALFTRDALLELRDVDPRFHTGINECSATELLGGVRRTAATPTCVERSRTVHVVGDVAVAISSFESSSGAAGTRGVNVILLRRSGDGWLVQSVVAQPVDGVISERSAAPPPRRRVAET
jgi:hypothetical protein